ncbi:MAG TPA: GNAT family N-acetyltransferase [Burkholderiaceae bacterium]|nr:GNAT family N-acetyltransferase [Burkholderiaceae bacterium]
MPLIFRITPLSEPPQLDRWLAGIGMDKSEEACVMVNDHLGAVEFELLPPGVNAQRVGHAAFAQVVGQLRGSPLSQQQAHAQRLEMSPVTFEGWVLRRASDSAVLACGQIATEADMVGLYDVFTPPEARNNGWARKLCSHLLQRAELAGARVGYLQVDAANHAARSVYRRLGFSDGYAYHYRTAPGAEG